MTRTFSIAIALLALVALTPIANADVKPGDVITTENAAKVAQLVSPGNYVLVEQGMRMDIVAEKDFAWPPPYKEATEQYSPQVAMTTNGNLSGYRAGLPFPLIDANDPDVARKIMWNFQYGPAHTDDLDSRNDLIECYAPGRSQPYAAYQVGHLAVYRNVGRTEVDPTPTDTDGYTGIMERLALGPIIVPLEPSFFETPWTYFVRYRFSSPRRSDLLWSSEYISGVASGGYNAPSFSHLGGGDTLFGTLDMDSLFGFSSKLGDWDFKLIGERPVLASVHAKNVPAQKCAADGNRTVCPENWELRHEYVVEADARRHGYFGDLPAIPKRILYIDSQGWFITAADEFDREGKLWKTLAIFNSIRDRQAPDSKAAVYNFPRVVQTAMVDENVQDGYSTILFTPNPERQLQDSWFVNQGIVSQRWIVPQRFTDFREYFY